MRKLLFGSMLIVPVLTMSFEPARAEGPSCKAQSVEKKLAGAAQTSFMKRCQTDAETSCNTAATDKKLAGAARTSFLKKCVNDAVGT